MTARFGALWTDNFPSDVRKYWAEDLADKTDAELQMGIRRVNQEWKYHFPPTGPEFRAMCVVTLRDLDLHSVDKSYQRAVDGQGTGVENAALALSKKHGHPFRFYFGQLRQMYLDKLVGRTPRELQIEPLKRLEKQEPSEAKKRQISEMLKRALKGS